MFRIRFHSHNGDAVLLGSTDNQDAIFGNGGNDLIQGYNDAGLTRAQSIAMQGIVDHDFFCGGGGNDTILGGGGNDTIYGDWGNDLLAGGLGKDWLEGGAGADIFRFERWLGTPDRPFDSGFVGNGDADTVADFTVGEDRLDVAGWRQGTSDAFVFLGNAPPELRLDVGQLRVRNEGPGMAVEFYRPDGDLAREAEIYLAGMTVDQFMQGGNGGWDNFILGPS